ncbi:VacJ [Uruburuella testudinis]|uniref:VacJ n=1 Tax=Uruburuella testudinis TaxID=1282863 RepID=A0ABY4DTH1_9NEIS|nr:VacJ [Uruburuella testudinis]UOO81892.1 VacJ [Uruburuella testudinis]
MYEVNRSVFILMPLEPFWNWLLSLPEVDLNGFALEDLQADANAYLVNPCDSAEEVWDEIESRFEEIFAAELADWCEDESQWPDLHADIFNEWFDIQLSTVLTDLSHEPLERESFQPLTLTLN